MPGNFLRAAYYRLTLKDCSIDTTIWFGAVFAHPGIGRYCVSIGSYSIMGLAKTGRTACSHVQYQRPFQHDGMSKGAGGSIDTETIIGAGCWSAAIVMANVGTQYDWRRIGSSEENPGRFDRGRQPGQGN